MVRRRQTRRDGAATIFRVMRRVCRGFALFIVFIVGVVAWRRLIIEGVAVTELERGEVISLGILLAGRPVGRPSAAGHYPNRR